MDRLTHRIRRSLRQPSTWAGLSAIGLIFGLPPGTIDALGQLLAGVGAVAAVLMDEGQ